MHKNRLPKCWIYSEPSALLRTYYPPLPVCIFSINNKYSSWADCKHGSLQQRLFSKGGQSAYWLCDPCKVCKMPWQKELPDVEECHIARIPPSSEHNLYLYCNTASISVFRSTEFLLLFSPLHLLQNVNTDSFAHWLLQVAALFPRWLASSWRNKSLKLQFKKTSTADALSINTTFPIGIIFVYQSIVSTAILRVCRIKSKNNVRCPSISALKCENPGTSRQHCDGGWAAAEDTKLKETHLRAIGV